MLICREIFCEKAKIYTWVFVAKSYDFAPNYVSKHKQKTADLFRLFVFDLLLIVLTKAMVNIMINRRVSNFNIINHHFL